MQNTPPPPDRRRLTQSKKCPTLASDSITRQTANCHPEPRPRHTQPQEQKRGTTPLLSKHGTRHMPKQSQEAPEKTIPPVPSTASHLVDEPQKLRRGRQQALRVLHRSGAREYLRRARETWPRLQPRGRRGSRRSRLRCRPRQRRGRRRSSSHPCWLWSGGRSRPCATAPGLCWPVHDFQIGTIVRHGVRARQSRGYEGRSGRGCRLPVSASRRGGAGWRRRGRRRRTATGVGSLAGDGRWEPFSKLRQLGGIPAIVTGRERERSRWLACASLTTRPKHNKQPPQPQQQQWGRR